MNGSQINTAQTTMVQAMTNLTYSIKRGRRSTSCLKNNSSDILTENSAVHANIPQTFDMTEFWITFDNSFAGKTGLSWFKIILSSRYQMEIMAYASAVTTHMHVSPNSKKASSTNKLWRVFIRMVVRAATARIDTPKNNPRQA